MDVVLAAGDQGWTVVVFWAIAGGLAGWLASIVARTNNRMGCLLNIVVGLLGAVVGGWLFRALGWGVPTSHPFAATVLVAFVGATIVLLLLRLVTGDRG